MERKAFRNFGLLAAIFASSLLLGACQSANPPGDPGNPAGNNGGNNNGGVTTPPIGDGIPMCQMPIVGATCTHVYVVNADGSTAKQPMMVDGFPWIREANGEEAPAEFRYGKIDASAEAHLLHLTGVPNWYVNAGGDCSKSFVTNIIVLEMDAPFAPGAWLLRTTEYFWGKINVPDVKGVFAPVDKRPGVYRAIANVNVTFDPKETEKFVFDLYGDISAGKSGNKITAHYVSPVIYTMAGSTCSLRADTGSVFEGREITIN